MAQVTLPYNLTAGSPENVNNLMSNLTALRDGVNTIDTAQLAAGAVTQAKTTGLPFGILGRHALTTSFTTSATHTTFQDEGLSTSVTYGANRYLRVTLTLSVGSSGGSQGVAFRVLRGSTTIHSWYMYESFGTIFGVARTLTCTIAGPSSGATETFKVQIAAATSNTAVNSYGNAGEPRILTVEDVGPQ